MRCAIVDDDDLSIRLITEYINQTDDLNLVGTFTSAIKASNATDTEQQLEQLDAQALLSVFPIWVVNVSDLRKILPLKMEMFDVAIIDEATQCDTACFLPLLQRAKRVVVAGDPKQLRHVSFLSYSRQQALMDKHGLSKNWQHVCNYRDCSLLDVTTAALQQNEQVSFLNEHYRSRPGGALGALITAALAHVVVIGQHPRRPGTGRLQPVLDLADAGTK